MAGLAVHRKVYDNVITKFKERDAAVKSRTEKVDKLMERTFASVDRSLAQIGGGDSISRTLGCIAMLHTYIVEQETRISRLEAIVVQLAMTAATTAAVKP